MSDLAKHIVKEATSFRLDRYCYHHFCCIASRSQAKKWIKNSYILLNAERCDPSRYPQIGDIITIHPPPAKHKTLHLPLQIHYIDSYFAIIQKPPGIHVSGNHRQTVLRALPANIPQSREPDALAAPQPVHRLDRRTSGLLLIARTAKAQVALGQMFEYRKIQKNYRAIVMGKITHPQESTKPINGLAAQSRWRPLYHSRSPHTQWLTEVEVWPHTGRTHQIRIHLSQEGHPIVGDDLYCCPHIHDDDPNISHPTKIYTDKGLFLSAVGLQFSHPITDNKINIQVDPPAKFQSYRLRQEKQWLKKDSNKKIEEK